MKRLILSFFVLTAVSFATVTVDGYALLENQTTHDSIQIIFERTVPSSLLDTTYTATDGNYSIQLETGIYDVTYTKDGYFSESLSDQSFYATTTLSSLTLLEHTTLINVPSLFSTIQSGIDHASEGDTVLVAAGTYVENINYNGKNIVVGSLYLTTQDTSYISSTIIDGNQIGSVVTFESGEDTTAMLIGFTIMNGSASSSGGGIRCYSSSPTITNVTISGNSASSFGGGIRCSNSSSTITNVTISGNTSWRGGGIQVLGGSITLTNVTISGNSVTNAGGGIYYDASSSTLTNVIIIGNSATLSGGGIYYDASSSTLTNVIIIGNSASYGGGIYCYSSSSPTITNSIISHNTGNYGIYVDSGNPSIIYSNFYNNQNGNFYGLDFHGVNVTTNANGDSVDAYNNIQLDPEFVDIDNNDYHLQNWSGLIGSGTTTNAPTTDIEGNPRPNPSGTNPDIGAYENQYGVPQYMPQVINVPTNYSTIQAALTAANATDTVLVQPGTYTENIIWPETNGIKLISAGDSSNTIIDGGGVSSVIHMNPQTATIDTTTLIQGFKITNGGNVHSGGGLYISFSAPILERLNISYNNAQKGGGAYINNNSGNYLLFRNSSIQNNTSTNSGSVSEGGGGISISGRGILENLKIKNNNALGFVGDGGGIKISSNFTTLKNSLVQYNHAAYDGGGVSLDQGGNLLNCIIINNSAGDDGGGIEYGSFGTPNTLENLFIIGNYANDNGGGVYSVQGSLNNSFIAYNNKTQVHTVLENSDLTNVTIVNDNLEYYAIYSNQVLGTIVGSNIISNSEPLGVVQLYNTNISQAINNWWGHPSGPYHPTQNPLGQGVGVSTFVNVTPWLTAPNTDAPPIPAQNTTVTGTGNDFISLKWDTSPLGDLAGYKLYYDSDSSGYPYANSVDIGTDTSYTLSSLSLGTTYYLAVTTYDTDGNESWYSNEVTGVTRIMQAQSLDIGGDEDLQHMVSHTPSITFGYYDSMNETQTSYQVQVSTDSIFSSANMWDAGSVSSDTTSVTYAGTALVDGTTYFLRVRVASGDFWSDWSTLSFRMNTEPTTPVLVSPINNQVSGTPVGLKVLNATDAEGDAITYSFNVYSDVTLTTKLDSATAVTEGTDTTSWQITATLPDNGQYFWTVSTNDGYEESAVSDAGSFLLNTDNNAPEAFALFTPADSTEVTALTPLLDWASASDPDPIDTVRYTLHYGTMIPDLQMVSVDTATSHQVSTSLSDNTTYYWKVVANDLNGASTENTGGYQTFYTNVSNDPPSVVTLVTPTGNSIEVDLSPLFYWTEAVDPDPMDMVSYHLFIDQDQTFTSTAAISVDSNGFNYDILNTVLADNAEYFWKVKALDDNGAETGSETLQFWTDAFPEPPLNFATVAPENNVEGLATEVEFIWEETDDPDPVEEISYRVVYASDWEDSSTYVYSETIEDTSMVITLGDNSQYYWLVEALDSDGFIVGSNENTPNVIIVGTLAIDGDLIPVEFALRQNYPNPFNPVTTLRYDLPENGHINITIYDMLGREVKTLINQTQDAGYKSVIWDATNDYGKPVSAGIYLYQIQAGEYMQTKKMVLLK